MKFIFNHRLEKHNHYYILALLSVFTLAAVAVLPGTTWGSDTEKDNSAELITTIESIALDKIITINERFGISERFMAVDINGVSIVLTQVPLPQDAKIIFENTGAGDNLATYVQFLADKNSWVVPE